MTRAARRHDRLLIVEDHELLGRSLCIALRAERMTVDVAQLTTPADLLAAVRADPPGVVLLDLHLGAGMGNGVSLVRPLTEAGARVLVVTGATDQTLLAAAVEQGAVGTVSKSEPLDQLVHTIRRVTDGEPVLTPDARQRMLQDLRRHRSAEQDRRAPFDRLTPREHQVLRKLGEGETVASIASEWVVSAPTVRSQVRGVLTKLGVSSQLAAVALARRSGWLPAGEPDASIEH